MLFPIVASFNPQITQRNAGRAQPFACVQTASATLHIDDVTESASSNRSAISCRRFSWIAVSGGDHIVFALRGPTLFSGTWGVGFGGRRC